jgi:hypothetical protein
MASSGAEIPVHEPISRLIPLKIFHLEDYLAYDDGTDAHYELEAAIPGA